MRIGPKTEEMREISTARLRAVGSCSALAAAQEEKTSGESPSIISLQSPQ